LTTLRGIAWDHPRGVQGLIASAYPYLVQSDVKVEWTARSLKDFGDMPFQQMAEEYDLVIVDHPHMGYAEATQCLHPLETTIAPDVLRELAAQSAGPSYSTYIYNQHIYALPVDAAVHSSVYRPDLLPTALPDDWQGVIKLGRELRLHQLWMAIPLLPTDAISAFITLVASLGAPVGVDGELTDPEIGLRALQLIQEVHAVAHPQSNTWNPTSMLNTMTATHDIAYCPLAYSYSNYARRGFARHPVKFANIPGIRGGVLGGAGIAVSAYSKVITEASAYAVWLCSAEVQSTLYVENGGQPGNGVAWLDERANRLTDNFFRDTLATLESAYIRPRHPGWITFQEAAGRLIHAMLRERTSSEHCLAKLQALYQQTK